MPGKDHRHDIQNKVRGQHNRGIEVKEDVQVHTITWYRAIPGLMEGSALEKVDKNTGWTETESDKVHEVDAASILVFSGDLGVEQEKGVFYGPVAEKVEDVGGHDQLYPSAKGGSKR
jgi:hypothetical protein